VLASAPSPGVEAPATAPVTSAPRAPEPAFGSSPSAASLAAPEPSTAPRAGAPTPPAVDGGEPAGDATDALEVAPLGEGSTFAEEYWQALVGSNTEAGSSGEADAWGATESDTQ
jgi:hypothetical protein